MTIKRKNIRPGGFLEVEADTTDTIDINGFSDPIQTIGAKTAKFSGGATMQANPGLRIGMTQLKINTGTAIFIPRSKSIEEELNAVNPLNMIDNNDLTFGELDSIDDFVTVDFGSVTTATLQLILKKSDANSMTLRTDISDDNINFTTADTRVAPLSKTSINLGVRTWRYVKIIVINQDASTLEIFRIFETVDSASVGATVKVHSSITVDTADGTILIPDQVMNENESLTFDTDLLLTGNPTGDFVTVEIVSLLSTDVPVTLSEITSIKEVP